MLNKATQSFCSFDYMLFLFNIWFTCRNDVFEGELIVVKIYIVVWKTVRRFQVIRQENSRKSSLGKYEIDYLQILILGQQQQKKVNAVCSEMRSHKR